MDKIVIKDTHNADSRSSDEITRDNLYEATVEHIQNVHMGMCFFADKI